MPPHTPVGLAVPATAEPHLGPPGVHPHHHIRAAGLGSRHVPEVGIEPVAQQDVTGFDDGNDLWRVRFSPDVEGEWAFTTNSGKSGAFQCVAPEPGNHGPVQVHDTWHFRYADGTPYYPFGTTCYGWAHQGEALEGQTIETYREHIKQKLNLTNATELTRNAVQWVLEQGRQPAGENPA